MRAQEVKGLMEAYSNVYAPQELTEDQVWEEVETWVNSLIEEGYDLREYTWEEMYEAYLEEIPGVPTSMTQRPQPQPQGANTRKPISNAPYVSRFARPRNAGTPTIDRTRGSIKTTIRPKIVSLDPDYKKQEAKLSAAAERRKVIVKPAVDKKPPVPIVPVVKPVTAAPKPATPAPNTSLTKASSALSGAGALAPKPKPQSDVGAMITRSQQRQADQTPKPAAPAPAKRALGGARERMLNQSFDVFDLVKGYLLDEGYADSEDAAMVIMVNMSEEWRETILESCGVEFQLSEVLDTPEKANEYGKKALGSMLGATAKALITKNKKYVKTVEKRTKGVEAAKRKAEKKAKEEQNEEYVNEDLEAWVDELIAEGYDLSEYTWEEIAEIYSEELELAESGKNDARIRGNIKSFGSNYTPPRDWDQSANRGQGAVLNAKQKEKQRRKSLRQEELELGENRRMAADPEGRKSGYSKQPDPSKEGFTGIGNMSIKQIMALNKKIATKKKED